MFRSCIRSISLLVCVLPLVASSAARAASDEELAKEACKCLEAPHKKTEEMVAALKQAQASGDVSQLMKLQGEMMGIASMTQRCFEELEKKHPDVAKDQARIERINGEIEKSCPAPRPPGMTPPS